MSGKGKAKVVADGALSMKRGQYETWSPLDDRVMLRILAEEVARGSRMGNGSWRNGMWPRVLRAFKDQTEREKTKDNVYSRQKTWKKQYQRMSSLVTKNGWGWDKERETIIVEDEEWSQYVEEHPEAECIRKKGFKNYDFQRTIVGAYMVTGDMVVHDGGGGEGENEKSQDPNIVPEVVIDDELKEQNLVDSHPLRNVTEDTSESRMGGTSSKRRRHQSKSVDTDPTLREIISQFCLSIEKLGQKNEIDTKWMDAVEDTPNLEMEERYLAALLLDTNEKKVAFLKFKPENRKGFLQFLRAKAGL